MQKSETFFAAFKLVNNVPAIPNTKIFENVCEFTKIWEVVVDIIKMWYTVDRKLLT